MSSPAVVPVPATARVRRPAPTFTNVKAVEQGQFKEVSLSDYAGKWVILLFYPMDFTFVCPTEILAFNDALPEFEALNTVVLGVSSDSEYTHFAWSTTPRKQGGLGPNLRLPLLADQTGALARAYGVYIEDEGHPLRGSFLIDPKGVLRQATINDKPVGRSVEEALRLLKAFQFTDKHGEVCPAGWSEGSRTIKADPVAKLEYFEGANGHEDVEMNGETKKRPRTN